MIPLQNFTAGVLAELVRRQPASRERTTFAWQIAAGPALARVTTVELENGTLRVRALDTRWLREIERERDAVLEKIQHLLGADQVRKITTGH